MALPVISNVFRCTLEWNASNGVRPVNVLHVVAPGKSEGDVGAAFEANITSGLIDCVHEDYQLEGVTVLKLDGVTAGRTTTFASATGGSATGDTSPASCVVVTLQTAQRGAQGRGRVYLGPMGESAMAYGAFVGSGVADMPGAWTDFITAMDGDGCALVVASYTHTDAYVVLQSRVNLVLGTQRRRQDQLR